MNSNIVKPEKFDHLHLVYHFTVPLNRTDVSFHKHVNKKHGKRIALIFDIHGIKLEESRIKSSFCIKLEESNHFAIHF